MFCLDIGRERRWKIKGHWDSFASAAVLGPVPKISHGAGMARTDKQVGFSPTGKLADVTPDMAASGISLRFGIRDESGSAWEDFTLALIDRSREFDSGMLFTRGLRIFML
jgi:hypothetical protein